MFTKSLKRALLPLLLVAGLLFVLPSTTAGASTAGCDYSAASQNNGWGWNPETGTSCAPNSAQVAADSFSSSFGSSGVVECSYNIITGGSFEAGDFFDFARVECELNGEPVSPDLEGCDYNSASQNNGYGWNPETRRSCPAPTFFFGHGVL